jgi:hypothetical protein
LFWQPIEKQTAMKTNLAIFVVLMGWVWADEITEYQQRDDAANRVQQPQQPQVFSQAPEAGTVRQQNLKIQKDKVNSRYPGALEPGCIFRVRVEDEVSKAAERNDPRRFDPISLCPR